MKTRLFHLVISFVVLACSSKELNEQLPQESTSVTEATEELVDEKIEVPKSLYGYYINVAYLESLRSTKSAKESQEVSSLSIVEVLRKEEQAYLRTIWNLHEGGDNQPIYMETHQKGHVISSYDNEKLFDLRIKPNGNIVVSQGANIYELERFEPTSIEWGFDVASSIVNQTLFEGQYQFGSKTVNLTRDGKVTGIDSIAAYYVNTDYIDAGMGFDKVYLSMKGKKYKGFGDEYGFEFRKDTLEIFRLNCLQYSSNDDDVCEDHSRGETVYLLVKK
jgi:hypothetical protein